MGIRVMSHSRYKQHPAALTNTTAQKQYSTSRRLLHKGTRSEFKDHSETIKSFNHTMVWVGRDI